MNDTDAGARLAEHTPGPWGIDTAGWPLCINGGDLDGSLVALIPRPYTGDAINPEANAMLIAAAPDLLEACRLARHICEDGNALQQQLDAAIAKATGTESHARALLAPSTQEAGR